MKTYLLLAFFALMVTAQIADAAPPAHAAAATATANALEDFRKTAIRYNLKYEFNNEPLTGADESQLALFPYAGAWPNPVTLGIVRDPKQYRVVGANAAGYSNTDGKDDQDGVGFAFTAPLSRGLVPRRSCTTFLLLGGVTKPGGIVATHYANVYVRGDMAGLLNLQTYSMVVVRGDLSGRMYCGSYANFVIYGKMRGDLTVTSSCNGYLVGGLSGSLHLNRGAKVWIGGMTPESALKQISGAGKVFLHGSDRTPGSYTRGETEIIVLGGGASVAGAPRPTASDAGEIKPTLPRHLRPFPDGPGVADVADVPQQDLRAGNNPDKRYALIGARPGAKAPDGGYKLLLILPGGDGSPDFNPFVRRIAKNALPPGYLVAQLTAPVWNERQGQEVIWPTFRDGITDTKFTTEQFIASVVKDVSSAYPINPKAVFALGWSSGGPPVYASLLEEGSPLSGAFVAMSVFHPNALPPLAGAKGKAVYLLHSPQDFIKIHDAETARDTLAQSGAKTTLTTYTGGHGWHDDPFGQIASGMKWLEANAAP